MADPSREVRKVLEEAEKDSDSGVQDEARRALRSLAEREGKKS
jgi:hypothetical protein